MINTLYYNMTTVSKTITHLLLSDFPHEEAFNFFGDLLFMRGSVFKHDYVIVDVRLQAANLKEELARAKTVS